MSKTGSNHTELAPLRGSLPLTQNPDNTHDKLSKSFKRPSSLRRARKSLSQEDFRGLITLSSAGITCFDFSAPIKCSLDPDRFVAAIYSTPSRCLESSLTFALSSGFASIDGVLGRSVSELLPANKGYSELFLKWHSLQLSGHGFEASIMGLNGEHLTMQAVVYGRIQAEQLERVWIVLRDVTPQARAVQALSSAEMHYRSLVERPGLLLVRIRPDEYYEYMSRSTQELLGLTLEEAQQSVKTVFHLVHPDDLPLLHPLLDARKSRSLKVVEAEHRIRLKNNEYHWFLVRQYPKCSVSGEVEYYDIIAFDVQNQRELELKFTQLSKSALIGQLSAGVAHDLNNHLTAISSQLDAAEALSEGNAAACKAIAAAQRAVSDCHQMGHQLLSVGRGGTVKPHSVNVSELITNALALVRYVIPQRIAVSVSCPDADIAIWADALQLQQVVINLVLNARDAISGTGRIDISVSRVPTEQETSLRPNLGQSQTVCITVRDTGAGISEGTQKLLFTPFFSTKRERGGHGLGLQMVKSLVEAHNGSISFRNEPSGGASFFVTLPILSCTTRDARDPSGKIAPCSIILAEDSVDIRHSLLSGLTSAGHRVVGVNDVQSLIAHLRDTSPPPDVLILDEHMPGQLGSEILPDLVIRYPRMRILFSSGGIVEAPPQAFQHSNVSLLPKPFSLQDLLQKLKTLEGLPVALSSDSRC